MAEEEAMEDAGHADTKPSPIVPAVDRLGRELQKWIQCIKCGKWRKVPYTLDDADIPEDWACMHNVWDGAHASCDIAQQLSDDEIDAI